MKTIIFVLFTAILSLQAFALTIIPALVAPRYKTVEMIDWKGQQDVDRKIIYYKKLEEREAFRVVINDGLFYDKEGNLLPDTSSVKGTLISYVMDAAGNFYLFDEFTNKKIKHSSVFAGGPVAGAGDISVIGGKITYLDANSGHYPADGEIFEQVLGEFKARGIDVSSLNIKP